MTDIPIEAVEGKITVPGGEVWYRKLGSGGVPLVFVHGGPGLPCDILFDAFAPLAAEREVVWYDQLQAGATHLPYLEQDPVRGPYVAIIRDYLARVERDVAVGRGADG